MFRGSSCTKFLIAVLCTAFHPSPSHANFLHFLRPSSSFSCVSGGRVGGGSLLSYSITAFVSAFPRDGCCKKSNYCNGIIRSSYQVGAKSSLHVTEHTNSDHFDGIKSCHYHLTILIPAYNERDRIGSTISTYMDYMSQQPVCQYRNNNNIYSGSVSVLVVDDGSTDGTADFIREQQSSWLDPTIKQSVKENNCWQVDHDHVTCISLPKNSGKGAAIERGMSELNIEGDAKSTRSLVLVADADGSGDISCIDNMIGSLESLISSSNVQSTQPTASDLLTKAALVVGYRQYPQSKSPLRSLLSWGFRTCVSIIFLGKDLGIRDTQCGFKLMTTSTGKRLYRKLNLKRWTHDVEVVHRSRLLGIPVGECSVPWVDKDGSKLVTKSSDAVTVSLTMLIEIAKMRILYALGVWKVSCGSS